MSKTYIPFWFGPEDLQELKKFVNLKLEDNPDFFNDISVELSVAKARTASLSVPFTQLSVALGLQEDSIPLYLTSEEKRTLLNDPSLPDNIRQKLI